MSTAHIPVRIPPIMRRMPVAKRLDLYDVASDLKKRRLAQKRKEQYIFWGIIAGLFGVISFCFVVYWAWNNLRSTPENIQQKIAVLTAQLEKAKTPREAERIANEIDRLEKINSSSSQVNWNKPFIISSKNSRFEITFKDISVDSSGYHGSDKKYKIFLYFTYKNLGPKEGDIYLAKMTYECGRNTYLNPGELKTEKGHIFQLYQHTTDTTEKKRSDVVDSREIGETGKTFIFSYIPYGSVPAEVSFGGEISGTLIIPKDVQEKIKKEIIRVKTINADYAKSVIDLERSMKRFNEKQRKMEEETAAAEVKESNEDIYSNPPPLVIGSN